MSNTYSGLLNSYYYVIVNPIVQRMGIEEWEYILLTVTKLLWIIPSFRTFGTSKNMWHAIYVIMNHLCEIYKLLWGQKKW